MATWDDVRRFALALPETAEKSDGDISQWRVKDMLFVWMRPLRKADYEALGEAAPQGPSSAPALTVSPPRTLS